ncbi:MAG TPA: ATP-dependent DNA helicase RecG [Candidatus Saccharimonadales bacterium]|nr:ATP-dependent DNA helicase RecG [Candidatus Saccharimonadales bacterium]
MVATLVAVTLSTPITELKGVGDEMAKKLAVLGIKDVNDLITNYPRRYQDYSHIIPVKDLRPGQVTLEAQISQVTGRYVRRGLHITEAIATDETGNVRLVWFNQPYRAGAIRHNQPYYIAGEYSLRRSRFTITNPSVELVSEFPINTARIIPIYRETKGLKSFTIRKLIRQALTDSSELPEHLPKWLINGQKLMPYSTAVMEMHFPSSSKELERAKKRLGFEEVFELTLAALLNKYELYRDKALAIPFSEKLARDFVAKLPFKLTDAQRKAAWQIYKDITKSQPMNRLLEGDVGSGKTVVAAMAALMALEQDFQVAMMAPTEILARQHADNLYKLLASVNYESHVGLLIGGLKPKQKTEARKRIAAGEIGLMVGTHALIAEQVDMHKLGLIIVDEQHRFGVEQRKKLQAKAGHMPHVLHMTATPIPRSLALTLYGELDISILDEIPPGRQPIITKIWSPNSRKQLYEQIDKELEAGRQMFIVCPLISDSETSRGLSVEEVFERISKKDFRHRKVGLLHGRLKSAEKDAEMQKFLNHEYDILVSTTVIEVGVDVPNATVMMVEGAERFGLAQIHQLRGRVGRAEHQSYCYLIPSDSQAPGQRLQALETMSDGFKLAELDLRLRGPGAIYGTMQHGALDLRVANLTDIKLIASARNAAQKFIEKGEAFKKYPHLAERVAILRAVTNLN